jgi:DNA-binding PadR family transcriptional regulator
LCWDLNIEEAEVFPAWDVALRLEFLELTGVDPLTGRAMYRLSDRGREALRRLRRRPRRATASDPRRD